MSAIQFFEEDISFKLKNKTGIRTWINNTITEEGYTLQEITYIFCSDVYLLEINRQYLHHDTFTDIITFDNSDTEKLIAGDIFISIERIKENSRQFHVAQEHELHRVMIHGALHLLGYKDKTSSDKKKMTAKEDFYLDKRSFN